jgi:peptide deformylase
MILPIYAYGHSVLTTVGKPIEDFNVELATLIENMWETMYNAQGVGLAAPQIGKSLRLFIVDTVQLEKDPTKKAEAIKKVFINPVIVEEFDEPYEYEEGCLSIPDIRGNVSRKASLKIEYIDETGAPQKGEYTGINARVIQHEYDHIDGKLFINYLKPLKRRRVNRKLENIKRGDVDVDYRMRFA